MDAEPEKKPVYYTLDERTAINVVRKSMMTKPEIIPEIMRNQAYAQAGRLLMQAKTELAQLLEVNRAFIAAASGLALQQNRDALDAMKDAQQTEGETK